MRSKTSIALLSAAVAAIVAWTFAAPSSEATISSAQKRVLKQQVLNSVDALDQITDMVGLGPFTLTTDFVGVAANACKDSAAITATGADTGSACEVARPSTATGSFTMECYVSAADAVKIKLCNPTGSIVNTGGSAAHNVTVRGR